MNRFSCAGCGRCCRQTASEETNFPRFDGILIQLRKPFIVIEEWHLQKLWQAAEKSGVKPEAEPYTVIFDLLSRKTLVVNYTTTAEPCVFLDDKNRCRIYEERPLICRAFPAPAFLVDMAANRKINLKWPSFCNGCPQTDDVKGCISGSVPSDEIVAKLYEIWGESLVQRMCMENIAAAETKTIGELIKDGLLRPAKQGYSLSYLLKRMEGSEKIPLSVFYGNIGKAEERRRMVEEFVGIYDRCRRMAEAAHKKYMGIS
jgi:Fe-S-cluster containining protein